MISAIYAVPPTSGPLQAYCWTAKECVCVSVFLTRRVMYVKRVAQGYLQTPPPPVRINGCFLRPCSLTRESGCHLTDENSLCEMDTVLTRSQANHAAV